MSGQASRGRASNEATTPEPRLRLITVGPSLVEQALRRDARVDLVRTREPLEALGELARKGETESGSKHDGEAQGEAGQAEKPAHGVLVSERALEGGEVPQFLAALRLIDPSAPVLLVAEGAQAAGVAATQGYDGVVAPDAGVDTVREAVRRAAGAGTRAAGPAVPVAPVAPPDLPGANTVRLTPVTGPAGGSETRAATAHAAVASASRGALEADAGDGALVQALLSGRDIVPIAMDLLRRRSGEGSLQFVPGGAVATGSTHATCATSAAGTTHGPGEESLAVAHRGRVLGWLRASGSESGVWRESVAAHAPWLASWLALAEQQATLRRAALTDDLTGAYNRRYFDRYLGAAIQQAHAQRQTLTLLVFDIDNFKGYNDRFGHAAGDDILRETVKLLGSVIRPGDRVCRIGGDEFAVVFYESQGPRDPSSKPPESVFQIARRFQKQIREHRFPKLGDLAPGTLTISGGLATYPWDGLTVDGLLQRADELALDSKRSGKNAITIGPGGATAPPAV